MWFRACPVDELLTQQTHAESPHEPAGDRNRYSEPEAPAGPARQPPRHEKPEQRYRGDQRERADVQPPHEQRSEATLKPDVEQDCQLGA
jgi:hypothetical protein